VERCREHRWQAVFLVGNPLYYARFGFAPAGPRGFSYGDPAFEPAFQVLDLEPHALAGCAGRVRFHPAFAEAEGR
jgi:putative acetyltransferase